jgi:phage tail tape-measure protein
VHADVGLFVGGDDVGASVRGAVGASVGASVGGAVRGAVGASVGASVGGAVRGAVGASVGPSVGISDGRAPPAPADCVPKESKRKRYDNCSFIFQRCTCFLLKNFMIRNIKIVSSRKM